MWQRFTERSRRAIFFAQEEAQRFGEGYVSTEHMLLGLIREPDCKAAKILDLCGISLNRVKAEVEKQLPRSQVVPTPDMTLTPRAKRVIDLAYDEARLLGHNYIGTEHLLLGLIRESEGLAGRILHKLGVDLGMARPHVPSAEEHVPAAAPESTSPLQRTAWERFINASSTLYRDRMPEFLLQTCALDDEVRLAVAKLGLDAHELFADLSTDVLDTRIEPGQLSEFLLEASGESAEGDIRPIHLLLAYLELDREGSRRLSAKGMTIDNLRDSLE